MEFITDRTYLDLEQDTEKAYIGHADLNRIEFCLQTISEELNNRGVENLIMVHSWELQNENNLLSNLPTVFRMNNLIANINLIFQILKSNFPDFKGENNCPHSMKFLTVDKMNELELTLQNMYKFLFNIGG